MKDLYRYPGSSAERAGRVPHFVKLFFSPISLILFALHFVVVVSWYSLFATDEPMEVPIDRLVFVIDILPLVAFNGPVERLVQTERAYFIVMGILGSIQWCVIGAILTSGWEWLNRKFPSDFF